MSARRDRTGTGKQTPPAGPVQSRAARMGDEAATGRELPGDPQTSSPDADRQEPRLDSPTNPERRLVPPAARRSSGGILHRLGASRIRGGESARSDREANPTRTDRRRDRRSALSDWLTALVAPGTVIGFVEFAEYLDPDTASLIADRIVVHASNPNNPYRAVADVISQLHAITSPDIELWGDRDTSTAPLIRTHAYDPASPFTVTLTEAHPIADTAPIAGPHADGDA